jgi:hypothetical protein
VVLAVVAWPRFWEICRMSVRTEISLASSQINEAEVYLVDTDATALIYDLAVVTRNSAHFESTGVRIVNPFT